MNENNFFFYLSTVCSKDSCLMLDWLETPQKPCRQHMGSPYLPRVMPGKASYGMASGPWQRTVVQELILEIPHYLCTQTFQTLRCKCLVPCYPECTLLKRILRQRVPYDSAMGFIILTWFLLSHLTGIKSFTVNTLTGLGHQSSLALQTPAFDSSLLLSLISFSCLVLHIACMNPDMAGPGQMTCLVSYQSSPDPAIIKNHGNLFSPCMVHLFFL